MRVVLQRVSEASVSIAGTVSGRIGQGLLILVGIVTDDEPGDVDWLVNKIVQMRIFADEEGRMNRSLEQAGGEVLLISQFTLHASTKKGNRPSYMRAAAPEYAIPLYESMIERLNQTLGCTIATGQFGADMQVQLINDGPVTIIVDSKARE